MLLDRLVHEETLPLDIAPFLAARFQPSLPRGGRGLLGPRGVNPRSGRAPDRRPFRTVPDSGEVAVGADTHGFELFP